MTTPTAEEHAAAGQRAINALFEHSRDWADVEFEPNLKGIGPAVVVLCYWAPECTDPDGHPIGEDPECTRKRGRVRATLARNGFECVSDDHLSVGFGMNFGQALVFVWTGEEEAA